MILKKKQPSLKLIAVFIWLVLSLALAGWWLLYGLKQLDKIAGLQNASAQDILRQHRMLMSEGGFLFALLLIGGVSLLYYISIEISRAKQIQTFFASFTHDLKTSLASLRLQAESLEEELAENQTGQLGQLTKRMIRDTVRLELQLNNSLNLAQNDDSTFFIEELSLKKSIENMKHQWTDFSIEVLSDSILKVDARALESICKNLIQNALIHGRARQLKILCGSAEPNLVKISFQDDGQGFHGETQALAQLFVRHSKTSGTGIGLYLVKNLCQRMHGRLEFEKSSKGFTVLVFLPGRIL